MNRRKNKQLPGGAAAVRMLETLTRHDSMQELLAQERSNAAVARQIYELRTAQGLTQKRLAELIGTQQPVIARLEDADYQGHSLGMLYRIAQALGYGVVVGFVPRSEPTSGKPRRGHRAARRTHDWIDERGRALGAAIAAKLKDDPKLLSHALRRIRPRIRAASGRNRALLREWEELLTSGSVAAVAEVLTAGDERAARLRQAHPFTDVLTPDERAAIFRHYETL